MLNSIAPLMPIDSPHSGSHAVSDLTAQLFEPESLMAGCDPSQGKYMACCLIYRGDIGKQEMNDAVEYVKTQRNKTIRFVDWCPTGFLVGNNHTRPGHLEEGDIADSSRAVAMIANSTAISQVFNRVSTRFDALFSRRAFVHHFERTGVDEMELYQARESLETLEEDYNEAARNTTSEQQQQIQEVVNNRETAPRLSVAIEESSGTPGLGRLSNRLSALMGNLAVPNKFGRISNRLSAMQVIPEFKPGLMAQALPPAPSGPGVPPRPPRPDR